ncbi:hypothetical protein GA0115259_102162 [Streptomyces sp. MnatMP-M17]|nr:hypothetical protein GA0115259_102162 [Streptomyces sp. MnatMP-M17]
MPEASGESGGLAPHQEGWDPAPVVLLASWKTLSQVELATAEWGDWYCHRRFHSEMDHVPPVQYEANYYVEFAKLQVTIAI